MKSNPAKRFYNELKRRKVISTAVTYLVGGWVIIEIASVLIPTLLLPEWSMRLLTILVLLGFPLTLVLAWAFDLSSKGIVVTDPAPEISHEPKNLALSLAAAPPKPDEAIASIAVMPFEVMSSNSEHQLLGQGITTEIQSRLAKLNRVRVASRRATVQAADANSSITQVAGSLNVRYLLSGNLIFSDQRIRVIAELDDCQSGSQIWAERYERELDDILEIMSDIADAVVSHFGSERLRMELKQARIMEADNLGAWTLVQKARSYLLENTDDSFTAAIDLLRKAIEQDADYADAQATFGLALSEKILNGLSENIDADSAEARRAIDHARRLKPDDSYISKTAGMALSSIGCPAEAIEALRTSVELAPYDLGAWGYFGWPMTARGREDDARELLTILERILNSAPNHPGAPYWLHHQSVAYSCIGDLDAALKSAERAVERHQQLSWAWLNYANLLGLHDKPEQARAAATKAHDHNKGMTAQHYLQQVSFMSENEGFVRQRTAGLYRASIL